ncbi:MAG: hypothetical protein LUF82_02310 [Clostridia bacterium]|nr:hypothetical protein [Clostridia bacterium]
MVVDLLDAKQQKFLVNVRRILFLNKTENGLSIVMEDGTVHELGMTYGEVMDVLRHARPKSANNG